MLGKITFAQILAGPIILYNGIWTRVMGWIYIQCHVREITQHTRLRPMQPTARRQRSIGLRRTLKDHYCTYCVLWILFGTFVLFLGFWDFSLFLDLYSQAFGFFFIFGFFLDFCMHIYISQVGLGHARRGDCTKVN